MEYGTTVTVLITQVQSGWIEQAEVRNVNFENFIERGLYGVTLCTQTFVKWTAREKFHSFISFVFVFFLTSLY